MASHGATKQPASISSSGHPSNSPPLAPARSVVLTSLKMSNDGSGKRVATMTPKNSTARTAGNGKEKENKEDKRLGVFLRVRPPVAGNISGKSSKAGSSSSSVEGCINTIEIISSDGDEQQPLPTTIRTYPPLNSNAAKVVRGGQTQASLKNALGSSKSLIANASDDSIVVDPHTEVRGVKEYSYSGVFGPDAMQEEVYNSVAAPLVEGLFPKSHGEELAESAQMAKSNRHTASNNINAESSRSHLICQLEIAHAPTTAVGRDAATGGAEGGSKRNGSVLDRISEEYPDSEYETDDKSVCSKSSAVSTRRNTGQQQQQASLRKKSTIIWIVDLAGSERSKRTRSTTRHQKEVALINASLMNLMRCLREMLNHQPSKKRGATSKSGGGGIVPFRESKLTHMFMNHLTGPAASRTSIIVNVNPAADDYDETQHILSYAATARSVTISAVDYNRKRRMFAQESSSCINNKAMKTGKALPREKLAHHICFLSVQCSRRRRREERVFVGI